MWTRDVDASGTVLTCICPEYLIPKPHRALALEEMQSKSPLNIDTVAKLVIQPITCNWNGCAATVNSWHTFQKVFFYLLSYLFLSLITLIQNGNTD